MPLDTNLFIRYYSTHTHRHSHSYQERETHTHTKKCIGHLYNKHSHKHKRSHYDFATCELVFVSHVHVHVCSFFFFPLIFIPLTHSDMIQMCPYRLFCISCMLFSFSFFFFYSLLVHSPLQLNFHPNPITTLDCILTPDISHIYGPNQSHHIAI